MPNIAAFHNLVSSKYVPFKALVTAFSDIKIFCLSPVVYFKTTFSKMADRAS